MEGVDVSQSDERQRVVALIVDGEIPADPHLVFGERRMVDDAEDMTHLVGGGVGDVVDEKRRSFVVASGELNCCIDDALGSERELGDADRVVGKSAASDGQGDRGMGAPVAHAKLANATGGGFRPETDAFLDTFAIKTPHRFRERAEIDVDVHRKAPPAFQHGVGCEVRLRTAQRERLRRIGLARQGRTRYQRERNVTHKSEKVAKAKTSRAQSTPDPARTAAFGAFAPSAAGDLNC